MRWAGRRREGGTSEVGYRWWLGMRGCDGTATAMGRGRGWTGKRGCGAHVGEEAGITSGTVDGEAGMRAMGGEKRGGESEGAGIRGVE